MLKGELGALYEKFTHHTLPRWEDLPEIDLYMDQVIALMRKYLGIFDEDGEKLLTPAMINNYVKMGAMPAPVKKKYSKAHIAHLLIICFLKQVLPISQICEVIKIYLNVYSESEMLNTFSSEYEKILKNVARSSKEEGEELIEKRQDPFYVIGILSMKAAAYAGAQRAMAQNLFFLTEKKETPEHGKEKEKAGKEK